MITTESLQVDDENRRHIVDLNLLDRLLMVDTTIAVPSIRLRQLLWSIELPEAVVDADTLS